MALKRVLKLLRIHLSHFYECSRADLKPNPKPIPKPNPEPIPEPSQAKPELQPFNVTWARSHQAYYEDEALLLLLQPPSLLFRVSR